MTETRTYELDDGAGTDELDIQTSLEGYLAGLLTSSDLVRAMRYTGLSTSTVTGHASRQLLPEWKRILEIRDVERRPNQRWVRGLSWTMALGSRLSVGLMTLIVLGLAFAIGSGMGSGSGWQTAVLLGAAVVTFWVGRSFADAFEKARRSQQSVNRIVSLDRQSEFDRFTRAVALPALRNSINELRETSFSDRLGDVQADGLREFFTPELEVTTRARRDLTGMIANLRSGTIGVSGRRGVGKTTLIRGTIAGGYETGRTEWAASVAVDAPVRFEPQEFLKHLFAELCLSVLGERVQREAILAADQRRWFARLSSIATFVGLLGVLLGAYAVAVKGTDQANVRPVFLVVSAIAIGGAITMWMVLATLFRSEDRQRRYVEEPEVLLAWESLDALHYLETESAEMGTEISAVAAKLTGKRGVSRAPQAVTMPELIAQYDRLVRSLGQKGRVFIGIDELDKMASLDDAQRFLNGIKSLFGQPNTFYVVSMSDDAMRSFEQRGLPVRDVFDSVFDDVLAVGPLDFDESTELLRRRVTGLAPPFVALCHALSGGLPRELVRVAREMLFDSSPQEELDDVAIRLIRSRNAARARAAFHVAQRYIGLDGSQPVLSWLRALPEDPDVSRLETMCDVGAVLAEVRKLGDDVAGVLSMLVLELAASWYHDATVALFFEGLDEQALEAARSCGDLELLTRGELDLETAPQLAWDTSSRFRRRLGFEPLAYPA